MKKKHGEFDFLFDVPIAIFVGNPEFTIRWT
jgi:hypothetical protein